MFSAAGTVVIVPLAAPALVVPLTSLRDQNTLTFGVVSSVISIAVMMIVGLRAIVGLQQRLADLHDRVDLGLRDGLLLRHEVGDHAADAADLLVGLDRLRDLHRHEIHAQQQRRHEGELDRRDPAPVGRDPGDPCPQTFASLPCAPAC